MQKTNKFILKQIIKMDTSSSIARQKIDLTETKIVPSFCRISINNQY